jgi:hypothetical protein
MESPPAVPKGTWVLEWNDERRHPGWQVTAFAPWREGERISAPRSCSLFQTLRQEVFGHETRTAGRSYPHDHASIVPPAP